MRRSEKELYGHGYPLSITWLHHLTGLCAEGLRCDPPGRDGIAGAGPLPKRLLNLLKLLGHDLDQLLKLDELCGNELDQLLKLLLLDVLQLLDLLKLLVQKLVRLLRQVRTLERRYSDWIEALSQRSIG